MTIIIIGSQGLVGNALVEECINRNIDHRAYCSPYFSLLSASANNDFTALAVQPDDCVINCVAYTAVDLAENDSQLCYALNAYAPAQLATYVHAAGAHFITLSTDYIFNPTITANEKLTPLTPDDTPNPINVYGKSKLLGEQLIHEKNPAAHIIRTSWIYSANPQGKDFVARMAHSAATDQSVTVVTDQIGSPTYVLELATALVDYALLLSDQQKTSHYPTGLTSTHTGIHHYSCQGTCSRYDLARTVYKLLGKNTALVHETTSAAIHSRARRPRFSALDSSSWGRLGLPLPQPWEHSIAHAIATLSNSR